MRIAANLSRLGSVRRERPSLDSSAPLSRLAPREVGGHAQIAVIVAYSVIIAFRLPEFWLHPYGPVVKNAVILAAIWLLYELEKEPWTTPR